MPYTGPALGARPSFEPRHGKVRRGRHIDLKPGTHGRQAVREPAPSDLSGRYGNRSAQSEGLYKADLVHRLRRPIFGKCAERSQQLNQYA